MPSVKEMVSKCFDFVGNFWKDPPMAMMMFFFLLIAIAWWFVFVLPIQIPLLALRDWSKTDKTLWQAYKSSFRGPIE